LAGKRADRSSAYSISLALRPLSKCNYDAVVRH
jgi:hypothetical protein